MCSKILKWLSVAAVVAVLNGCYSLESVAVKIPANTEEIPPEAALAYLATLPVTPHLEEYRCVFGSGTITDTSRRETVALNQWNIYMNEIHWGMSRGGGYTDAKIWLGVGTIHVTHSCAVYDESGTHGEGEEAKQALLERQRATMRKALIALKALGVDVSSEIEKEEQTQ